MEPNVSEVSAVETTAPAPVAKKPVAKRTTTPRKRTATKAKGRLRLPPVPNADGSANAQLVNTMSRKFQKLVLISGTGKSAKETPIIGNVELGHLANFLCAMANSWSSGTGSSADGSTLYVDEHYKTVLEAAPQLRQYAIEMETNQGGFNAYRLSFADMLAQVRQRATALRAAEKAFGLRKAQTHQRNQEEPEFVLG